MPRRLHNTRLVVIVIAISLLVLLLAWGVSRIRYNASVSHDMTELATAVGDTNLGNKPLVSFDQLAMSDSLRLHVIQRGYSLQQEPRGYKLCGQYYGNPWTITPRHEHCILEPARAAEGL